MEDGLPSNTVYDVFQDSRGFVWVATENGLARFNGVDFKVIPVENVRSLAMGDIQEDALGTIWCINFSGQVLNIANDTLRPLEEWEEVEVSGFPELLSIEDNLFIIKHKDIWIYNVRNRSFVKYQPEKEIVLSVPKGTSDIWCSYTSNTLTRILPDNLEDAVKVSFDHPIDPPGRPIIASYGNDWFLMSNVRKNITQFDSQGNKTNLTDLFEDKNQNFRDFRPLGNRKLIFYGSDGAVILDSLYATEHILKGENIGSAVKLNEGGLLIATLSKGLYLIPTLRSKMIKARTKQGINKLAFDHINDRIIAGDIGGNVLFYDRIGNELKVALEPLSTSAIQSLLVDQQSNRLFAQSNQLLAFELESMRLLTKKKIFTSKQMMIVDSSYYLAASTGLNETVISTGMNDIKRYGEATRMNSMMRLSQNELVLGTQRGTLVFDLKEKVFNDKKYVFQQQVQNLRCALVSRDMFIFGSATDGVFIYNQSLELIKRLTISEGLLSNQINAMDTYENTLAVGTNRGISIVDLNNWEIENIEQSAGLHTLEVSDLLLINDSLVVAGSALQFFKLPINKKKLNPKVFIDELAIDNKKIKMTAGTYKIPYGINELVIRFDVSNAIQDLGNSQIYYRIKELSPSSWNALSLTFPLARYLSLPSGKYTLESYAVSSNNIKSTVLRIPIEIEAPFWKRWWFLTIIYSLCASVVILIALVFFKISSKKKQNQLIRKNRSQQLRIAQLTSIRAQMNPHFIFNTMTLIQGLVQKGEPKAAGKTIQDFSKLMRGVLELSSQERITLDAELQILTKYLEIEKRRFDDELQYSIVVDPEIIPESIQIPSLLTQPYVENALRHGLLHKEGSKELTISFTNREDHIQIEILDNGIGRQSASDLRKQQMGKSFATEAYQKRIDLINESNSKQILLTITDLLTDYAQPNGTLVTIKIPFGYE